MYIIRQQGRSQGQAWRRTLIPVAASRVESAHAGVFHWHPSVKGQRITTQSNPLLPRETARDHGRLRTQVRYLWRIRMVPRLRGAQFASDSDQESRTLGESRSQGHALRMLQNGCFTDQDVCSVKPVRLLDASLPGAFHPGQVLDWSNEAIAALRQGLEGERALSHEDIWLEQRCVLSVTKLENSSHVLNNGTRR